MLREIVLHKVEIVTFSKLNTHKLHKETIFISAPRDVRAEIIEQTARNYCYAKGLTVSSAKSCPVFEQPTFDIIEVDRLVIEKGMR